MKIVYGSDISVPSQAASSINVMKMCQAFSRNGHEVLLMVPTISDSEKEIKGIKDIYEYYGVEKSFKIIMLPRFYIFAKRIIHGFRIALRSKKISTDLIYSRSIYACFFGALVGITSIYESHVPERGYFAKWIFSVLKNFRHFRRVVVISDALKKYYQTKHSISEKLVRIAHDGADELMPCEKMILRNNSKCFHVGYVGHLYKGRGIEVILELARHCKWADFHIIGGLESDVKYWKEKSNNIENIFIYGFVPPSETDGYRQSFDVLIAPYQKKVSVHGGKLETSQWMSPLKIFEYMAAGKAILCSDMPALKEILTDKKTALMCDPENVNSWEKALKQLYDDEKLRSQLGKAALSEFQIKYTWKARAANVLNET